MFVLSGWSGRMASFAMLLVLASCASTPPAPSGPRQGKLDDKVALFSANRPDATSPAGWQPWIFSKTKPATEYRLTLDPDSGKSVVCARSVKSASALIHPLNVDTARAPLLSWRWKASALIDGADNTTKAGEDSPLRIFVGFDGDRSKLGFADQMFFEQARLMTGYEPPYATLMYVWENKQPIGTVLRNPHTSRIRMMVAESGPRHVGDWVTYERNLIEDYRNAYGEEPGRIVVIGIMTDTDNTGTSTEAWYGDIRLVGIPVPFFQP